MTALAHSIINTFFHTCKSLKGLLNKKLQTVW